MKLYFIEYSDMKKIEQLFTHKFDNEYIVLNSNGNLSDIAQYSEKYQNVHFATVPCNKLDPSMRLY